MTEVSDGPEVKFIRPERASDFTGFSRPRRHWDATDAAPGTETLTWEALLFDFSITVGSYANAEYVQRCNAAGNKLSLEIIGQKLSVDHVYMEEATNIVLDAGVSLFVACWQKISKEKFEYIASISNEISYLLMKSGAFRASGLIIDGLLDRFGKQITIELRQAIKLNLANCHKKLKDQVTFKKIMATEQWQSSSEIMRMCAAALLENKAEVIKRISIVKQSDDFPLERFIRWMVFDWIREAEWFQEAVKDAYGRYPTPKEGSVSMTNLANISTSIGSS
jgi:hypothetical protein